MSIQTISTGSGANDGTGDTLRTAMQKINENFAAIAIDSGTWTPVLRFGSANSDATLTASGRYAKVGIAVVVSGHIQLTNKGTVTGSYVAIGGLPFNTAASGVTIFPGRIRIDGGTGITQNPTIEASSGQLWVRLETNGSVIGNLSSSNFTDTTELSFTIVYFTA